MSTSFVGRSAELAELAGILGNPACRLLTLLGPGGIGKTRLALEGAAQQSRAFADGVAFVGLPSASTPNQIVSPIGDALGLAVAGHADSTAEVLITLGKIRQAQRDGSSAYTALVEALQLALALGPRLMVAAALEGLACVVVPQGDAELAARLLAAALALREQMGIPMRLVDRAGIEQALTAADRCLATTPSPQCGRRRSRCRSSRSSIAFPVLRYSLRCVMGAECNGDEVQGSLYSL